MNRVLLVSNLSGYQIPAINAFIRKPNSYILPLDAYSCHQLDNIIPSDLIIKSYGQHPFDECFDNISFQFSRELHYFLPFIPFTTCLSLTQVYINHASIFTSLLSEYSHVSILNKDCSISALNANAFFSFFSRNKNSVTYSPSLNSKLLFLQLLDVFSFIKVLFCRYFSPVTVILPISYGSSRILESISSLPAKHSVFSNKSASSVFNAFTRLISDNSIFIGGSRKFCFGLNYLLSFYLYFRFSKKYHLPYSSFLSLANKIEVICWYHFLCNCFAIIAPSSKKLSFISHHARWGVEAALTHISNIKNCSYYLISHGTHTSGLFPNTKHNFRFNFDYGMLLSSVSNVIHLPQSLASEKSLMCCANKLNLKINYIPIKPIMWMNSQSYSELTSSQSSDVSLPYVLCVLTCKPFKERGILYHSDIEIIELLKQTLLPSVPLNIRFGIALRTFDGLPTSLLHSIFNDFPNVNLITENLFQEVGKSDLVLGYNSTVLEECVYLGKQVVIIDDQASVSLVDKSDSYNCIHISELKRFLYHYSSLYPFHHTSLLQEYLFTLPDQTQEPLDLHSII